MPATYSSEAGGKSISVSLLPFKESLHKSATRVIFE